MLTAQRARVIVRVSARDAIIRVCVRARVRITRYHVRGEAGGWGCVYSGFNIKPISTKNRENSAPCLSCNVSTFLGPRVSTRRISLLFRVLDVSLFTFV